jgi:alkanesulfonate monooxygenase SsuD/methylene tetrahydromethanopterin reductase-like flavin-dependent oxidoreductase (luciferase family)
MRQLWTSPEPFEFKGDYFPSDFYYLYTKPKTHIPVYFSAVGKKTAYCAGKLGTHLITINRETTMRRLREEIIPAFRQGCREVNKDVGEIAIGISLTLKKPQEVWESSRKSFGYIVKDSWSLKTPVEVDRQGEALTISDLTKAVHFCENWDSVIEVIQDYRRMGATSIILSTGLDRSLMKDYADNLLPAFQ